MSKEEAALALRRFGLGSRPGDIDRIASDPKAAILAELDAADSTALDAAGLPPSAEAFRAIRRYQLDRKAARDAAQNGKDAANATEAADTAAPGMMAADGMMAAGGKSGETNVSPAQTIYRQELAARVARSLSADIGYVERLVAFWTNHFALQADKDERIRSMAGAFEREAIRPHVLGRFEDMLLAATRHPAMLLSLDNADSTGPNSPLGRRRGLGLNENHAREIMELHTIGVDGGYDQADVIEFAKMLTGWTIVRDMESPAFGTYAFLANRHEPGDRMLLGKTYSANAKDPAANERQGLRALRDLARNPATARRIASKLARHFVDDDPPQALVDELATRFQQTGGDLRAVSAALVESPAAWREGRKFLTPQQFVFASMRACETSLDPPRLLAMLRALGQLPWSPPSPAGYHDDAATWLSPDGITTRLDVADRIAQRTRLDDRPDQVAAGLIGPTISAETLRTVDRAESGRQAVALLLMSPEFQWR